ncbi:beta-N-acetylhexosaminidase [Acidihalobacter prosperus]
MGPGPLMLDLEGLELSAVEREMLRHPQTGGVILFSRNYESVEQLGALVESIHAVRDPHLLVAVDHEGGRVQRFREGFTRLPPAAAIGRAYDADREHGRELAKQAGWLMAAELRAVGLDFSFAPVLDLAHGVSGVIGDRAFHRDPQAVAILAQAYVHGMREAGMAAVGKHFPGHGGVREDSHLTLPEDTRSLERILAADTVPFAQLAADGLAGIMPAHVRYAEIDELPAGFSRYWLNTVLRQRLGFQGAIFSDDLSMAGAEFIGDYPARAHAALEAGCDMVLVCNHPQGAAEVLDALAGYDDAVSRVRLARFHARDTHVAPASLRQHVRWRNARSALDALGESAEPELNV